MISCLDSRYSSQLEDLKQFLGDEAFVYYMSIWSISYAEITNDNCFLPIYDNRKELYERVKKYEIDTKHQMTALLKVLQKDYPKVTFHIGITSEDIMHNSRCLQMNLIIEKIHEQINRVDEQLDRISSPVTFPILGHTHGQPATPIKLSSYLRAKCSDIFLSKANYRLGGSNGQLTILKQISEGTDFNKLGEFWLKRTSEKIRNSFVFNDSKIVVPTEKVGLLQVGPHNDATFLSGMSLSLKFRALSRAFWDHASRGILKVATGTLQTGSSAMPHKVNPILFENSEGCFSIAYSTFQTALEANCDSRGLRDLSNSIVNRQILDGWAFLYLGIKSLVRGMEQADYNIDACYQELYDNPECLTELLRYYMIECEGVKDPYFELKNNPPKDFNETIDRMSEWKFDWQKD